MRVKFIDIDHDIFDGRKLILTFHFDDGQELILSPPLPKVFDRDEVLRTLFRSNLWLSVTEAMKVYFGYTASTTWALKKLLSGPLAEMNVSVVRVRVYEGGKRPGRIILTAFRCVERRLRRVLESDPKAAIEIRLERSRFMIQTLIRGGSVPIAGPELAPFRRFLAAFLDVPRTRKFVTSPHGYRVAVDAVDVTAIPEKINELAQELAAEGFLV